MLPYLLQSIVCGVVWHWLCGIAFTFSKIFQVQSENLIFFSPELVTTRTCVLDYFYALRETIKDDHLLFQFETSSQPGNILKLLEQLCWEMGFPTTNLPLYITGEQPEILYLFPELRYYRDVVFMFKYLMAPTAEVLPEIKPWMQRDAILLWTYKESEGYVVSAFNKQLKCVYPVTEAKEQSVWEKLFRKPKRVAPSGADPSVLVNQQIEHEEDVLHVQTMPTFNDKLTQSASELLVTYLTAPYLRIPLVLHFFSNHDHIKALSMYELQCVVDSVVFEPGMYHPPKEKVLPTTIPATDR